MIILHDHVCQVGRAGTKPGNCEHDRCIARPDHGRGTHGRVGCAGAVQDSGNSCVGRRRHTDLVDHPRHGAFLVELEGNVYSRIASRIQQRKSRGGVRRCSVGASRHESMAR